MNARKAQALRDTLLIVGFILMLGAYIFEPLFIIGLITACSCLIPDLLFNKCPHCGKHLGRDLVKYCQHCGKRVDE